MKRRVKDSGVTHPVAVRNILLESLATLLKQLERPLVIGEQPTTVIMVAGVNGAGKTTSIGKLTKHLTNTGAQVLLAARHFSRCSARAAGGLGRSQHGRDHRPGRGRPGCREF